MREADLQARILKWLRSRGGWWVKFPAGPYAPAGVPDILGCYRGRFVAIEVKKPGGGVTKLQAATQERIAKQGQGLVATAFSLDDVRELLDNIDLGRERTSD